ncbi:MAG: glycosyltransferase family 4 protein, partial [Euryarchaeota archaeon]|nr:glycosyltransferase family 4 protein [Euryarchaeota archaeon]
MRIAVVNPFHYPFMGGIEHRIHHVGRRLGRRHEVTVLTGKLPGTAETEQMDNYIVRRFPSAYFNLYNPPMILTTGIRRGLRELKPDIIELHYRWAGSYTRAVMSQDCPKVFIWHNSYGEGEGGLKPLSFLNDMMFARHLRRLDRLVCVSEFLANELLQRGWPKDLISVVPNGVDMPENLGEEEDFILFVGRLVKPKGLPYLLGAMRSIDQKLVICGSGPERERLERLA